LFKPALLREPVAKSILIITAHPAYHRSRANRALRFAAEGSTSVTMHDLYEAYPDFLIDIEAEKAKLEAHDHIVLLHPFYWYSSPAIVKEWLDLVLEYGWAYGEGGTALRGKTWTQAITAGAPEDTYMPKGRNRFSIEELTRPFEATAHLCGCLWQPPFILNSSREASAAALMQAGHDFRSMLEVLARG
jgi:glutathione-regulated potassium-efflux system ancillary protein KefG